MRTVTFIETEESEPVEINPDHVQLLKSNGRDDGESTILELSSGLKVTVDGTLEEVKSRLKAAE